MRLRSLFRTLAAVLGSTALVLAPLAARPLFANEDPDGSEPDQTAAQAASVGAIGPQLTTFAPQPIPLSANVDIANPFRGVQAYLRGGQPLVDSGAPYVDSYSREKLYWYQLESSEGVYNFSQIDEYLKQARARGGKYGLRIMAADNLNTGHTGPYVPKYLWDRMPGAYTYKSDGVTVYMPDFDSPVFLTRARALIAALAARYADDPRLGWVETGFMGMWGEWHVANAPRVTRGTLSRLAWTIDSGKQIVDAWHDYFPNKRLIALTLDFDVLDYALDKDPRIGWRHDCLGGPNLDSIQQNPGYLHHVDQWKTAPIFWEACGPNVSVALSRDQVIRYHFAGGHSIGGPMQSNVSPSDQALLKEYRELAGYRFQVNRLTLPSSIAPGETFSPTINWSNVGLTPAYTPWAVRIQLRNLATNGVVWEGASGIDLQAFLPTRDPNTGLDTALDWTDTFELPANVPPAMYDVALVAADPSGYYQPLGLANQGRRPDGSYVLGSLTVTQ